MTGSQRYVDQITPAGHAAVGRYHRSPRPRPPGYRSALQYALGHVDSSESILRELASGSNEDGRLGARNILTAYALLHGQVGDVRPQLEAAAALVTAAGGRPLPLQDTITVAQIQLVFLKRPEVAVRMLDRALLQTRRDLFSKPTTRSTFARHRCTHWRDVLPKRVKCSRCSTARSTTRPTADDNR